MIFFYELYEYVIKEIFDSSFSAISLSSPCLPDLLPPICPYKYNYQKTIYLAFPYSTDLFCNKLKRCIFKAILPYDKQAVFFFNNRLIGGLFTANSRPSFSCNPNNCYPKNKTRTKTPDQTVCSRFINYYPSISLRSTAPRERAFARGVRELRSLGSGFEPTVPSRIVNPLPLWLQTAHRAVCLTRRALRALLLRIMLLRVVGSNLYQENTKTPDQTVWCFCGSPCRI